MLRRHMRTWVVFRKLSKCREGWNGHSAQRGQKATKALGHLRAWCVQGQRRPRQPALTVEISSLTSEQSEGACGAQGTVWSTVEVAEGKERGDKAQTHSH